MIVMGSRSSMAWERPNGAVLFRVQVRKIILKKFRLNNVLRDVHSRTGHTLNTNVIRYYNIRHCPTVLCTTSSL